MRYRRALSHNERNRARYRLLTHHAHTRQACSAHLHLVIFLITIQTGYSESDR